MSELPTASQTIGPFFAIMRPLGSNQLVAAGTEGAITIFGTVFDGEGQPVTDAVIEAWQANRHGRYHHPEDHQELLEEPGFTGFGRCATDANGRFEFVTVKPGRLPGQGSERQAPHITLLIHARGLLRHLVTRVYFEDEAEANAADPLLRSIEDEAVRATLIAKCEGPGYRFDIRLRGEGETAFLAI